ncbi:nucleotide exchange factor GrpE [Amphibacillus sp. MSJ-3]|uniref:nucleotide exchange factor GrpE n=1 Tax=Amphibacillus sp. MSJ-3 TaxID=2841505 RepID=UPI001C0F13C8|nr:nucleotide exchange factor GrpE [Amphibacillus sp. MSJ-3]MBU5595180.1 nucleotide exchange factor GrpE [Amphibacillus sp. MSJ-3]
MEVKDKEQQEEVIVENESTEDEEQINETEEVDQELVEETVEEDSTEKEYQQLVTEKEELFNKFIRLQAEYDNYRKRTQREKSADLKYKSQALITELLPVIDNFERALQTASDDESVKSFIEGMDMIYRQLQTVLEAEGVEVIPTVGEEFDPNIHQAVMQVEDDQYETNVVVEEMQKGYRLKDRVIRPAMVKVNQ